MINLRLMCVVRPNSMMSRKNKRFVISYLERLESRLTPSTFTWSGDGASGDWSDPANWGGAAPTSGADLVFPASAVNKSAINDFSISTTFNSITIEAPGYSLSGTGLTLAQGITDTATSGITTISNFVELGSAPVTVDSSTSLVLSGGTTSSGVFAAKNLTLDGGGTLVLSGILGYSDLNTVNVNSGVLELDQQTSNNTNMSSIYEITIGDGTHSAAVIDEAPYQLYQGATVTVDTNGTFNLNGNVDNLDVLFLDGGNLATGSGILFFIGGDVYVNSTNTSMITGRLQSYAGGMGFKVDGGSAANPGLILNATIVDASGILPTVDKLGAGTMVVGPLCVLPPSSSIAVEQGTLELDDSLPGTSITVASGATLGGSGSAAEVNSTGGTLALGNLSSPGSGVIQTEGLSLGSSGAASGSTNFDLTLNSASSFGQVVSQGIVVLSSTNLSITLANGYTPTAGSSFYIIDNQSGNPIGGAFQGLAEGYVVAPTNPGSSIGFEITYQGGVNRNDVVLTTKNLTTISVASSVYSAVFGQPVTLTATIAAMNSPSPTGTVDFYSATTFLGSATISGSQAILNGATDIPVGTDQIVAVYQGDSLNSASSSNSIPLSVAAADTQVNLQSSMVSSVYGQDVAFTAMVAATAPGVVTPAGLIGFYDGAALLGTVEAINGSAIFSTSTLAPGTHHISAQFYAGADFNASVSSTANVIVSKADPTVIFEHVPEAAYGLRSTFQFLVQAPYNAAAGPTGSITLTAGTTVIGTVALSNGGAYLVTYQLPIGTYNVTATYNGDANYTAASNTIANFTVYLGSVNLQLDASSLQVVAGRPITISAQVIPTSTPTPGIAYPSGTVSFFAGSALIGEGSILDGIASVLVDTSKLVPGIDSISAIYSGDSNYGSQDTVPLNIYSGQVSTTTSLDTNPYYHLVYGQKITLTALVNNPIAFLGPVTGEVSFYANSLYLGSASLVEGVANLTTTEIPTGIQYLVAEYSGNSYFIGSSNSSPTSYRIVDLNPNGTNVSLTSSIDPSVAGEVVDLTASVHPQYATPQIPSGFVSFYRGSTLLGEGNLIDGSLTIPVRFSAVGQSQPLTVYYGGSLDFFPSVSARLLQSVAKDETVNNLVARIIPIGSRYDVQLIDTVTAALPGEGGPTGVSTLELNGKIVGRSRLIDGFTVFNRPYFQVRGKFFQSSYLGDSDFATSISKIIFVSPFQRLSDLARRGAPTRSIRRFLR